DVRHVLNGVIQWDTRMGFTAGLRGFVRSGEVDGFVWVDDDLALSYYSQRLPWFARLDASMAYAWDAGWARLKVSLEWMNVLFFLEGEALGVDCASDDGPPSMPCPVTYQPQLFLPNLGIRGEL